MTQTRTEFTVVGKDRLSDAWATRHFSDRALAELWAGNRAFVLPDSGGRVVREVAAARIRLERYHPERGWEPHTAWYDAHHRDHLQRNLSGQATWDPNNQYRLVEETSDVAA